jgi:hypothetical protein
MEQAVDEYEDQEDTDDEDVVFEEPTGCCCVHCVEEIEMVAEVFLLRIVQPLMSGRQLQHVDITTPDGGYRYDPAFFCFDCWEEVEEELTQQMEDIPPLQHAAGLILCDICQSDVLQGEAVGVISFGEIHWSERAPNHNRSPVFVDMDNGEPKHICIGCIHHLEENRKHPLWPEGVDPVPGMTVDNLDDLFGRTWRTR